MVKKNYIIWSPNSTSAPTRRFTEKQAKVVAEKMSKNSEFYQFFVCKIVQEAKTTSLDSHRWTKVKEIA